MRIKRIYNNSVLLAEDENHIEYILVGKGLAFQKKAGNLIDEEKVEKRFIYESGNSAENYLTLVNDVPVNHINLVTSVMALAQQQLCCTFDDSIYIALTDHISYAIKRKAKNMPIRNALLWEIKRFYQREFAVATQMIERINYEEDLDMDEHEAGFITMYLVSGIYGEKKEKIAETTSAIKDILNIVQFHFRRTLNEGTIYYSRFVTHITYLLHRMKYESTPEDSNRFLYDQVAIQYEQAHLCALKIQTYLINQFQWTLVQDELAYLIVHIQRLIDASS